MKLAAAGSALYWIGAGAGAGAGTGNGAGAGAAAGGKYWFDGAGAGAGAAGGRYWRKCETSALAAAIKAKAKKAKNFCNQK